MYRRYSGIFNVTKQFSLKVSGPVAQSVASRTADPWVASSVMTGCNTFVEIDPPFADSRRVVVIYKQTYVHKVLVNRL